MTGDEKRRFEGNVSDALLDVRTELMIAHVSSSLAPDPNQGNYAESYDSLSAENPVFDLDNRGPNNDEMIFRVLYSADGKFMSSTLTVYKAAYEAYSYGSPAARGYTLSLPRGYEGLVGLIMHESGHGVLLRNMTPAPFRPLPNFERVADDWVHIVWPGRF